jgi:invasion protein IalB
MRALVFASTAALILAPLAAAPAFAQDQQQQQARKTANPDEVVCEKQQETGSRLSSQRVCMTRSQWAEQRRVDRQEIDKAQIQRPQNAPQ